MSVRSDVVGFARLAAMLAFVGTFARRGLATLAFVGTLGLARGGVALGFVATLALAPSNVLAQSDDEAHRVFLRAAAAYGNGEFEVAADLFEQAYALRPEPQLLYSLGSARERAGRVVGAIEAYEAFLREVPDAEERSDVERSLDTLRRQRALEEEVERRREAPVEVVVPTTPARPAGLRVAAFSLAGVGVLTLGVGVALGLTANARYDDARDESQSHRATLRLEDEARRLGRTANALFGVGGVLTLTGIVWAIVELVLGGDDDSASSLRFGPRGFRWRFG
jgi:tetratricopeptide (TPR) repeat protein